MKYVMSSLIICAFASLLFCGCASLLLQPKSNTPAALTPQQQLTEALSGTNWVTTLMLFGIGAGFFAFLNGNSKGLQAMAACFVVLSLALGIARFSLWISAASMAGAVCLMIYTVLVKNRALKEVVKGVQEIRTNVQEGTNSLDLPGLMDSFLKQWQSPTTEKIIKKIKETL
jgi:phosphate/sulfate permease